MCDVDRGDPRKARFREPPRDRFGAVDLPAAGAQAEVKRIERARAVAFGGPLRERVDDVPQRLGLLDSVGGRSDEEICSFCLSGARDLAWQSAERFARATPPRHAMEVEALDRAVMLLGAPIHTPTPMLAATLAVVRAREISDVGRVVQALS